eukprot:TRINITY_DN6272_c0_g1_i1.p1 TRINITY_DN6272_c0_g1~~TRINITY_DN6272_c0_g1_i1.p1  ORF type:complete len:609 (-),score=81.57 TRINITY_DN6272_c0_g1_i1:61-1833(-)
MDPMAYMQMMQAAAYGMDYQRMMVGYNMAQQPWQQYYHAVVPAPAATPPAPVATPAPVPPSITPGRVLHIKSVTSLSVEQVKEIAVKFGIVGKVVSLSSLETLVEMGSIANAECWISACSEGVYIGPNGIKLEITFHEQQSLPSEEINNPSVDELADSGGIQPSESTPGNGNMVVAESPENTKPAAPELSTNVEEIASAGPLDIIAKEPDTTESPPKHGPSRSRSSTRSPSRKSSSSSSSAARRRSRSSRSRENRHSRSSSRRRPSRSRSKERIWRERQREWERQKERRIREARERHMREREMARERERKREREKELLRKELEEAERRRKEAERAELQLERERELRRQRERERRELQNREREQAEAARERELRERLTRELQARRAKAAAPLDPRQQSPPLSPKSNRSSSNKQERSRSSGHKKHVRSSSLDSARSGTPAREHTPSEVEATVELPPDDDEDSARSEVIDSPILPPPRQEREDEADFLEHQRGWRRNRYQSQSDNARPFHRQRNQRPPFPRGSRREKRGRWGTESTWEGGRAYERRASRGRRRENSDTESRERKLRRMAQSDLDEEEGIIKVVSAHSSLSRDR